MKAILIIDMPKHCLDCPCYNARNLFCQATLETYHNETGDKPEWCPLRHMPEKKEQVPLVIRYENDSTKEVFHYGEIDGWNKCLKEIEKRNE